MYEIKEVSPMQPAEFKRNAKFPLAALAVHQGFVIKNKEEFKSARNAAAKHNRQFGTMIRCNMLVDGTMQVWRDVDPSPNATQPALQPIVGTEEDANAVNPTKLEFFNYVRTLQPNQTITLHDATRFDQFKRWLTETKLPFVAQEIEAGQLTVTRQQENEQ